MSQQNTYQRIHWLKKLRQRQWIPLLLGIVVTIAVLGLWQQLWVQEQWHIQTLVQQEADAIESRLSRELSKRILTLEQMADRWQAGGGEPQALWQADAMNNVEHYYGYQAIEWVDPTFHVRWVVPLQGNEAAQNLDLSQEPRRQITLSIARDLHQTILTRTVSLVQGGKGFLAYVPLFVKDWGSKVPVDRFDGFIVGVFRFQSLFDSILETSPRYRVQIYDHNGLIYGQDTTSTSTPAQTVVVQTYGADWQIKVFPTSALISKGRSPLPTLVLWGGLADAWILALIVYLGQRFARQAQQTRTINQQLQHEIIHRQQVEANLRASEERWQLALRGNNDGIWDWNMKTNEVFFSNRWKAMLGFEEHEIGNHLEEWKQRIHPDELQETTAAILNHLTGKTPFYVSEHRVQCKDGFYKWILDRGQALWDEAGNAIRMVGSYTDITERKQTEIVLQTSEAKYRQLIDHINAGFVVHAPDTRILQCNATACDLLGLSMDQLLGKVAIDSAWHFVREDGTVMPVEEYPVNRVLLAQVPLENYVVGIHQGTQSRTWVLVNAFPEFNADYQLKQIVVTFIDISKLKRAETELRETAEVMEYAISGISKLDAQGRYLYVNKAYANILGYHPEEMMGMAWQQTVHPSDLERIGNAYQQMVQDGKVEVEARGICQDGSSFYKHLVMIATYNEQQQFIGHYCFSKDISDRKQAEAALKKELSDRVQLAAERQQAEAALRQSEATKQAIIQAIPDLLIRIRSNGDYVEFISSSSFNIVNPTQMRQNINTYDILTPELAQLRMHYTRQALESNRAQIYEHKILVEGKQCYEEVRIVPLLQDEVLVMVRDITDRKQAEEDLRHQKEMFQAIVNHIPMMITLWNDKGHIEFINPELKRVLGWSLEDWQQQDVFPRCYPDIADCQSVVEYLLAASGRWQDMVTLTATGRSLETSWAHVRLSNGQFLSIGQDISDRKRKEIALRQAMEAAEAANLAKSMFLASMSHELRTPLNVILGFAQVMAHDPSLSPSQLEDLKTIRRSGDHLLSLINDVLDLSKIEAGHCTIETVGFDLISLLHTLRTMMVERAKAKQLQLMFDIAADVPQFVIADEQKLRQILLNLLSNAIKFTHQGSVTLRVRANEWERGSMGVWKAEQCHPPISLQFAVTDTGVGIASEEQSLIFDAFVQAEAGKKSVSGTGLGLTISRKLLELMHGTISVHSVLGEGSTFTIMIPVHPTSSIDTQPEQYDRTVIGLVSDQPDRRVLVVDDQQENRLLMVRLLTLLGLEVREAINGQEAIQLWQEWQPDLTWMDIWMPGVDGYEATRQIRAMEQGHASIIIALTAQASQSDRALALAAGCNDYISKPFQEETVFLKMSEYLGLKYLYAEPTLSGAPVAAANPPPQQPSAWVEPSHQAEPDLSTLPEAWLSALEDASFCCDDQAVIELVRHLPPEFTQLALDLKELAKQFQFEQILNLLHGPSPP